MGGAFSLSRLYPDRDGSKRVQTMTTVPKDDFRPLPYLVALGAVGAATVGVFFGIGFLLLSAPHPATPSADPGLQAQALEAHEVPPPANNDTASGSSLAPPAEKMAASPTSGALSNWEGPALEATAMEAAPIPPAAITHAKRVRVVRYHRQVTGRHWAALWRPDASAGPNPGGGFYSPPNINVGYINPR
jgi:hypothetical protein